MAKKLTEQEKLETEEKERADLYEILIKIHGQDWYLFVNERMNQIYRVMGDRNPTKLISLLVGMTAASFISGYLYAKKTTTKKQQRKLN